MEKITIEIQEDLLNNVNDVLDDIGLDINSAIKMFFKRIDREKSINFILTTSSVPKKEEKESMPIRMQISDVAENIRLTKSLAIRLFEAKGHAIGNNVTFASKNKMAHNYWANPDFSVLETDWELVLNDWIERRAYLFRIPSNSINANVLVCRNDKKSIIDLQIAYGDISFTDNRSKVSFKPYLVDSINY